MTELEDLRRLRAEAEVRAFVHEHGDALGIARTARPDLVNALVSRGATAIGGQVRMPCGTTLHDYAQNVIIPSSPHWRPPEAGNADGSAVPAPTRPRDGGPQAGAGAPMTTAQHRANATARLAEANGHD